MDRALMLRPFTRRTRRQLVCAACVLTLSLCGAAAALGLQPLPRGASSLALASSAAKSWQAHSWMGDLFSDGKVTVQGVTEPASSVTLGQLAIPGSHDSGAYFVRHYADECQATGFLQRAFGEKTTQAWARTQHYDLYTQAALGVRSFDIRPYYTGSELRTCHTLDTASLADVFTSTKPGNTGLRKFIQENPKEVLIINLSHFRPWQHPDTRKWTNGIAAMGRFLRDEVCPHAISTSDAPDGQPGSVSLGEMWRLHKNYVVLADNENDFYRGLFHSAVSHCIFNSNDTVSGGYAGEHESVSYGNGQRSSTNLWRGLFDDACYVRFGFLCGTVGADREHAGGVRDATERELIKKFRNPDRKSLQETSYIWVYGTFAGFDNYDAARFSVGLSDASLITATEDRRLTVQRNILSPDVVVNAGLLPYARQFIERLEAVSDRQGTGVGVNIVNMDAIGRSDLTRDGLVEPMMQINRSLLR